MVEELLVENLGHCAVVELREVGLDLLDELGLFLENGVHYILLSIVYKGWL